MGDVHVIPTGPEWVVQVGDDLHGAAFQWVAAQSEKGASEPDLDRSWRS